MSDGFSSEPSLTLPARTFYNTRMATSPDVLVIGGGIIGLTTAYFLADAGRRVEVLDKGEFGREASWAGAGILPPGDPAFAATPVDRLRAWGVSRFAAFSGELQARTGIDNGYRVCGGIEFLTAEDRYAVELWQQQRIRCERLTDNRLEPRVRFVPDTEAWHLPDCAQVRNPWHLRALIAACQSAGVALTPHAEFRGWERTGNRVSAAILTNGERRSAGQFLLASGAWADAGLAALGVRLGVTPVRGQIVLFRCPQPPFTRVLMHGKRYLVPRADGRVLVGSTEEPEAGFEKANTADGIADLTRFAFDLCTALREAEIEQTWAGLRPGSPDGLPFLGPVPGVENVFCAAGHFRAGVQLSLGTARLMTDLLTGTASKLPAEAFRLDRPATPLAPSAFRS